MDIVPIVQTLPGLFSTTHQQASSLPVIILYLPECFVHRRKPSKVFSCTNGWRDCDVLGPSFPGFCLTT